VSGPRNKVAYVAAQELHEAVRTIVAPLICPCCRRAPLAKEVRAQLPPHLVRDERTIRTHIRRILNERTE
jgi:hypothetical protein